MATFIALLRAVNVGGTGKLPMAELRATCEALGFTAVRTYIQSGNVVFGARPAAARVRSLLESALAPRLGGRARVQVRTAAELEAVLAANPFPAAPGDRVIVLFLDAPPDARALARWPVPGREQLRLVGRELFLHFPDGQGTSKLKVPFADEGTGRNLNTVRALVALARGESPPTGAGTARPR